MAEIWQPKEAMMGSIMVRSCARSERGRVMCNRMARYGDYRDAGAFSNVVPMPLHRDNRHIIDAWGRINDPKHRFWASFQLWIWILERGKKWRRRLGKIGGNLVYDCILIRSRIKDTHFWRQTNSLRKEIWHSTPYIK